MTTRTFALFGFLLVVACREMQDMTPTRFTNGGADVPAEIGRTYRWSFDDVPIGDMPADFIDVLGTWSVAAEPSAPSTANVLRQSDTFGNPDFPRVVVSDLTFADLGLRVRCRPEGGSTDQACGLMFRLVDSDDYYLTRANALEGNVVLFKVVNGDRREIASARASVESGAWHTLEVAATAQDLMVTWDGAQLLTHRDGTFARGHIGLWTKADSVTAFDDLEATAR